MGRMQKKIIQHLTSVICKGCDANDVNTSKSGLVNAEISFGENSMGICTPACRCSELSPDLEGLKLDMVILESYFGKRIKTLEDKVLICTNEHAENLMTQRNNNNNLTGGLSDMIKVKYSPVI